MSFPIPASEIEMELSPSSTVPGEIEIDVRSDSTPTVIEVESSEDEAIMIQIWSPAQEVQKMKDEERYGYYYRVVDRERLKEDRLRAVRDAIAAEDPESRKARRRSFQKAVYGEIQ